MRFRTAIGFQRHWLSSQFRVPPVASGCLHLTLCWMVDSGWLWLVPGPLGDQFRLPPVASGYLHLTPGWMVGSGWLWLAPVLLFGGAMKTVDDSD